MTPRAMETRGSLNSMRLVPTFENGVRLGILNTSSAQRRFQAALGRSPGQLLHLLMLGKHSFQQGMEQMAEYLIPPFKRSTMGLQLQPQLRVVAVARHL